jgi:hypothetical protein
MVTLGCAGLKYDPKSAAFYQPNTRAMSAPPRTLVRPHCSTWRTTEADGNAFLDDLAHRAQIAHASASRLNGSLELTSGTARLRMTSTSTDVLYDCCETEEGSCRSLLGVVLESDR